MALSEKRRQQLDGIVAQMESNGETTDDIQFVVDDFKNKYGDEGAFEVKTPPQPPATEPIWSRKTGEIVPENVGPYYKKGIKNLAQKPYETLFPGASSVQGAGIVPAVKRNVLGAFDVLQWPDRAVDYVSGGAIERGKGTIGEAIEKIPGNRGVARYVKDVLQNAKDIATSPTTYVGFGTIKNAIAKETPETVAKAMAKKSGVESYIKKGVDKGIKPTVRNKSNFSSMKQFEKNADVAVKTIVENKDNLNLVNEFGEKIVRPRSAAEMAQAIEQTKGLIYKQYHKMSTDAGGKGIQTDITPVVKKLNRVSEDLKFNPQIRSYAKDMVDDISELKGAAPEIIEERIKDLNRSLAGFYDGRVSKAKAQIDASVAGLMREQLDESIASVAGEGYQALKNKYGALKSIEKEVNHRAIVNARKNVKGLSDLTDVFTGGDLIGGVLTMNPAMITRGVAGRSIKEIDKSLNNPDRYINNMFKKAYNDYEFKPQTFATPEKSTFVNISDAVKEQPAYIRKGLDPEGDYIKNLAEKNAVTNAIKGARPKVSESQANIAAMREFQRGVKPKFPGIIKNKKGAIGGVSDDLVGTPAIRDPKTGKIYTGGWRGHKDAIVKGETSEIQERLKHQHFLDNTNKPTSNVGYIDKSGNFISRSEAEKIMEKKLSSPSHVSQFHNVGIMAGAAAGAGGALTIGAAAKNRNKRK